MLTILENIGDGLVQFELLKTSSNTTMQVTCTNEQFDTLVKEQAGLSGAAQIDAAISQLFREAHEEIEKPPGVANQEEEFGEDFGAEFADVGTRGGAAGSQAGWHIKSQQPWQLAKEHCTLTIQENSEEGLVQFDLLNNTTNATMYVTCTNAQFDELLQEQTGLSGVAQVNAAIAQMFKEAHQEIQWPQPGESIQKDARVSLKQPVEEQAQSRWQIQSQQPWELDTQHCTLTILENSGDGFLQFELLKLSTHSTVYVMCTYEQFDCLCSEQGGLAGPAQTNAAIAQLFREAQDEMQSK